MCEKLLYKDEFNFFIPQRPLYKTKLQIYSRCQVWQNILLHSFAGIVQKYYLSEEYFFHFRFASGKHYEYADDLNRSHMQSYYRTTTLCYVVSNKSSQKFFFQFIGYLEVSLFTEYLHSKRCLFHKKNPFLMDCFYSKFIEIGLFCLTEHPAIRQ